MIKIGRQIKETENSGWMPGYSKRLFGHPIFNLDTLDISSDTPDMAYAEAVSPVRLESNEN